MVIIVYQLQTYMDFLIFSFAYAIIILGFVVFASSDAEQDPQDDFHFADGKMGKLPKQKISQV